LVGARKGSEVKIFILFDLHIEFGRMSSVHGVVRNHDCADVVVLAGDIARPLQGHCKAIARPLQRIHLARATAP
jgi:Icc-related predicted phosphoesterase